MDATQSWKGIRHFSPKEFDSPDAPGSGLNMDLAFVAKLDELRDRCGFPFSVNSGYRTPAHNTKVSGVQHSAHTSGHAADIRAESSGAKFQIIKHAIAMGFTRIGVGATFVHVDDDETKPQEVVWLYAVRGES